MKKMIALFGLSILTLSFGAMAQEKDCTPQLAKKSLAVSTPLPQVPYFKLNPGPVTFIATYQQGSAFDVPKGRDADYMRVELGGENLIDKDRGWILGGKLNFMTNHGISQDHLDIKGEMYAGLAIDGLSERLKYQMDLLFQVGYDTQFKVSQAMGVRQKMDLCTKKNTQSEIQLCLNTVIDVLNMNIEQGGLISLSGGASVVIPLSDVVRIDMGPRYTTVFWRTSPEADGPLEDVQQAFFNGTLYWVNPGSN